MNGQFHRKNGPAVEWANGSKEWWLNGKKITEEMMKDADMPSIFA